MTSNVDSSSAEPASSCPAQRPSPASTDPLPVPLLADSKLSDVVIHAKDHPGEAL